MKVLFPQFEMVVNPKTAKALGLAVPPSIMLRAEEGDRVERARAIARPERRGGR